MTKTFSCDGHIATLETGVAAVTLSLKRETWHLVLEHGIDELVATAHAVAARYIRARPARSGACLPHVEVTEWGARVRVECDPKAVEAVRVGLAAALASDVGDL